MVFPNLDRDVMMTYESVHVLPHVISDNVYEPTQDEMGDFLSGFIQGASNGACDFSGEIDTCYRKNDNSTRALMTAMSYFEQDAAGSGNAERGITMSTEWMRLSRR